MVTYTILHPICRNELINEQVFFRGDSSWLTAKGVSPPLWRSTLLVSGTDREPESGY